MISGDGVWLRKFKGVVRACNVTQTAGAPDQANTEGREGETNENMEFGCKVLYWSRLFFVGWCVDESAQDSSARMQKDCKQASAYWLSSSVHGFKRAKIVELLVLLPYPNEIT